MTDLHIIAGLVQEMVAGRCDQVVAVGEGEADKGVGGIGEKLIGNL